MSPLFALIVAVCAVAAPTRHASLNTSGGNVVAARQPGSLPDTFQWESSAALLGPKDDSRGYAAIKDPSIIYYEDRYHVFASTAHASTGYNMVYMNFTDFDEADSAPFYYLDQSAIGSGYRAAPQIFYFEPQNLWYLVFQTGNAAYSTNTDINNPAGWTAPKTFYSGTPRTISRNIGNGYWVDMWVICDASDCYLLSSDDNGHLFQSQTSLGDFPSGMSEPVIIMSDPDKNHLLEASNVYKIGDDSYLLLVEAIDGDSNRYFRSWTSTSLSGEWTALADTESNPFARSNNVAFSGTAWSRSISHGEMIRTEVDQTMTISPCNLRYLYQGILSTNTGNYNGLPWKLGLITQTNSAC
ncbi:glycosyl hydrolase family 62-domain-containing protein [Xylariaceae sp. FL0662B]|nr:glycosyl hydrolase family 62-domain-containing protein [Xylariaceae sp. FL0662B]